MPGSSVRHVGTAPGSRSSTNTWSGSVQDEALPVAPVGHLLDRARRLRLGEDVGVGAVAPGLGNRCQVGDPAAVGGEDGPAGAQWVIGEATGFTAVQVDGEQLGGAGILCPEEHDGPSVRPDHRLGIPWPEGEFHPPAAGTAEMQPAVVPVRLQVGTTHRHQDHTVGADRRSTWYAPRCDVLGFHRADGSGHCGHPHRRPYGRRVLLHPGVWHPGQMPTATPVRPHRVLTG